MYRSAFAFFYFSTFLSFSMILQLNAEERETKEIGTKVRGFIDV